MIRYQGLYVSTFAVLIQIVCIVAVVSAQGPAARIPRPSQKASVMQTIGVTDLTITYSRPGVKARKIWGDAPAGADTSTATLDDQNKRPKDAVIVPYGHVWRTGANEATTFSVTDDLLINGHKLAAGTYSLHSIPGKDEWTIIFNSDAGQWGSFDYDVKKDVLRVTAKPEWVAESQEWLLYSVPEVSATSARIVIRWEKVAVPFTVEVPNVDALMRSKAQALAVANPNEWKIPLAVGNYYANEAKPDEALKWIEQSIKIKETFSNLSAKARQLAASGKKEEAFAIADQAVLRGKTDKVDTSRFEKWLTDLKAGKP